MSLMPEKKSERVKVYVLIAGAVVFMIVGYFRFIHKKPVAGKAQTASETSLSQLQVPVADTNIQQTIGSTSAVAKVSAPAFIRDIFSPVRTTVAAKEPDGLQQSAVSLSEMVLNGTIVGSGKPMAIINNQFLSIGDWIGEYRVKRIDNKAVIFDSGNHQIELEMVKDE